MTDTIEKGKNDWSILDILQAIHVHGFDGDFQDSDDLEKEIPSMSVRTALEKINSLLAETRKEEVEKIKEIIAKDRPMFIKNNIVSLLKIEEVKKIRSQLRKEILDDLSSLSSEQEGK
jgi:hypothetical protein